MHIPNTEPNAFGMHSECILGLVLMTEDFRVTIIFSYRIFQYKKVNRKVRNKKLSSLMSKGLCHLTLEQNCVLMDRIFHNQLLGIMSCTTCNACVLFQCFVCLLGYVRSNIHSEQIYDNRFYVREITLRT
jgi:hypothetical protein